MKKTIVCIIALTMVFMVGGFAQAEVSRDGLIAEYLFNGDADDTSGNENHGIVYGATLTEDRSGNPSGAYRFDGVDDNIDVQNSDTLDVTSAITIEAWVNIDGPHGGQHYIVDSRDGLGGGYGLNVDTNAIQFWIGDRWPTFNFGIEPGEWHHVVGTYDGNRMMMYIDGDLRGSVPFTAVFAPSTGPLFIGTFWHGPGQVFRGVIDEVDIWNRVLTPEEVLERYGTILPVKLQGTIDIHPDIFEVRVREKQKPKEPQKPQLSAYIELQDGSQDGLSVDDIDVSTVTLSLNEAVLATAESPEIVEHILKVSFYLDLDAVSTLLGLEANKVNVAGGKVRVESTTPPTTSIDCIELTVSGDFLDDRGNFNGKDAVRMMLKE